MPLSVNKKFLLLDSCITEYWLNKDIQPSLEQLLTTWAGTTFDLAISEISFAELVDGAIKTKINRVKDLLTTFTRFEVTERVLSGAGILSNVYMSQNKVTNGAGLQDKIIAATAFIFDIPIITADVRDFPHPFFVTIASENLKYEKKGRSHFITIDVLKPNTQMLKYWYSKTK